MQSDQKGTEAMKRSKRTVMTFVRLSPEEKKAFEALAERLGTDLSELIRQGLHAKLRTEKQGQAA
jgi:predicted transcriptional regulator